MTQQTRGLAAPVAPLKRGFEFLKTRLSRAECSYYPHPDRMNLAYFNFKQDH